MLVLWIIACTTTGLAVMLTMLALPVVLGLGIGGTFAMAFGLSLLFVGSAASLLAYGFSGLRDLI